MSSPHCSDAVLLLNVGYVIKAKDKDQWQRRFSHFCSRAANEEEEIAHKLLGEQFRVSLQLGHVCVNCVHVNVCKSWHCCAIWVKLFFLLCRYHHFLFHPGAAGLVTQPFQSSTLWWRSQSGKRKAAASTNYIEISTYVLSWSLYIYEAFFVCKGIYVAFQ